MKIPSKMEEVTPAWFTQVLAQEGHIINSKVVRIKTRPLGSGIGFLSTITHVSLEYDHPEPTGPTSLVVKLQLSSGALRELSEDVHAFEREIRFYRDVPPLAPIRLPRCYFAAIGSPSSVLVMEDLTFATPCDQVKGLHAAEVIQIARLIGRLQGKFWNNDTLASLTWMPTTNRQFWVNFDSLWDRFLQDFDGSIESSALQVGERLRGQSEWLENETDRRPRTLVHSDLKADNILLGPSGTPESILILDWQLAIRSMGAFDVARLMGGSELPDERHDHQLDVLRAWYEEVRQSDVDYGWEEAVNDLRLGGLQMVCWAIQFYASVADLEGRPRELVTRVCERAFDSAMEMDAVSILPQQR
ncbi:oxidoreductase family protein [Gimesia aquarii]|uniref:Phosphotransferase enzyme family protein n=1 Tax=Gimesia aquarii TaxID=2527964 RepID=A0A517WQ25_9PLAN|nr:phosphotransferase [Gimesia aquarii]QDU07355.1 Phosphotransferase enzyme family protein [Gimesia aquarii]